MVQDVQLRAAGQLLPGPQPQHLRLGRLGQGHVREAQRPVRQRRLAREVGEHALHCGALLGRGQRLEQRASDLGARVRRSARTQQHDQA